MNGMTTWPQMVQVSQRKPVTPRVLIVRLSAVGDCLQTMPLACAIRSLWPAAQLTWVVEKGAADLVKANTAVDSVVVLPKKFATLPSVLWRLSRQLQRQEFDLVLDPQGLTKSGLVSWLSGAPRRIGFARPAARELNPWFQTEHVVSREPHRVDRYLELLKPLGFPRAGVDFGLSIPALAAGRVSDFMDRPELCRGFAALNPGAGWDSKRWPIERYAEVARHLAVRGVPSVVTWGGSRELAFAETIVAQAGGTALLAPATSLLELAVLLRRAQLFVGSDTGPLHLASAVGTLCVALFGASGGDECGPWGSGHVVLQNALDLSPRRKQPGADNWALRQISVAEVCAACDQVLAERSSLACRSTAA